MKKDKEIIKKLAKEHFKLKEKITKLELFLNCDIVHKLDSTYVSCMVTQLDAMKDYNNCLKQRINLLKG